LRPLEASCESEGYQKGSAMMNNAKRQKLRGDTRSTGQGEAREVPAVIISTEEARGKKENHLLSGGRVGRSGGGMVGAYIGQSS